MWCVASSVKSSVRSELRRRRREIAVARDLDADAQALARHGLATADAYGVRAGDTVTLYASRPLEPPTGPLVEAFLARGIRVLLPITLSDLDLDWVDATDPEQAPLGLDAVWAADLALVPGLAADPTGTRLGQGGGCYDKALPRMRPGTPVVVLLHPGEYAAQPLPREAHDQPVGAVLTAEGLTALA